MSDGACAECEWDGVSAKISHDALARFPDGCGRPGLKSCKIVCGLTYVGACPAGKIAEKTDCFATFADEFVIGVHTTICSDSTFVGESVGLRV